MTKSQKFYMRTIFCFLILHLTFQSIQSQDLDYQKWKEDSKSNIRLLPKYGEVLKTKEQKDADEDFIKEIIKQDGDRLKGSEHLVSLGFNYLYRGDLKTAMYRFNQAWLLNPKNENAFWGFGAVYFMFYDFDAALKQYEEGLSINPKSSNLLTDKATILLTRFGEKNDKSKLNEAIAIFKKSYEIDPNNQNTILKLSACYFYNDDCKSATKYFDECVKLGGKPITKEYEDALKKKCR